MATITSSTGVSGLAIDSIVSGLMTVEKQPLTLIQSQISSYNTKLSAYSKLKSGLSTFQDAVDNLASASKFNAQTATPSDTTVMTTTADGTATSGSYSIAVSQLATSQKLATSAFTSTSSIVGTGTLTISYGTFTSGSPGTFDTNSDKDALSIDIDSTNNTLSGIRDAINAKGADVSASIVNDGTGYRLVITSKSTGAENSLNIAVTDDDGTDTDSSGLSMLAYDPTASSGSGQNMTQLVAAQDAKLTVDGLSITSASNKLTDVIQGVTLNLKTVTSSNITLDVATDTDSIQSSVQSFVDAYNTLNTTLRNLTKFVEGGSSSNGPLLGDGTTRDIMVRLKAMLNKTSDTAGTYKTLSDIGVAVDSSGTLTLSSSKLSTAIENNLSDVAKLFAPSATTTDSQVTFVSSSSSTKSGTYAISVSQLGTSSSDTVGTINGVTAYGSGASLIGANNNDSQGLKVMINGTATGSRGTVTFSKGLAGELSDLIDGWLADDTGSLTVKTDGIQKSIDKLNDKSDALQAHLTIVEQRYRTQYANLDALLSSMQNTSSYITQMVSALSSNN